MFVKLVTATCVMFCCAGCSNDMRTVTTGFYVGVPQIDDGCRQVIVDWRFTAAEAKMIDEALAKWNTALDGSISLSSLRAGHDFVPPQVGSIARVEWENTFDETVGDVSVFPRVGVIIDNVHSAEAFDATVTHEFGHWLGIGHIEDTNSIMHTPWNKQTDGPTQVDIDAFYAFLGGRTPCVPMADE